jgi:hypothetical protein
MSVIFEYQNETVWEPSLATGHMFYGQLKSLERFAGHPCGVIPTMGDMYEIVPEVLGHFLESAMTHLTRNHRRALFMLAVGPLQVALGLYNRMIGTFPVVPSQLEFLLSGARDFDKSIELAT